VVANLGAAAAADVSVDSQEGALPPGTYAPRNLLGGPDGTVLRIDANGRVAGYVPAARIGARESLLFDLIRR
jgi:hypothetical protein